MRRVEDHVCFIGLLNNCMRKEWKIWVIKLFEGLPKFLRG